MCRTHSKREHLDGKRVSLKWSGQFPRGLGSPSEGPPQGGGMGTEELSEVQREVQGPAAGEG